MNTEVSKMERPDETQPSAEGVLPNDGGLGDTPPTSDSGLSSQPEPELGVDAGDIPDDPEQLKQMVATLTKRFKDTQAKLTEVSTELARVKEDSGTTGEPTWGGQGASVPDPWDLVAPETEAVAPEAQAIQQLQQQVSVLSAVVADVGIENQMLKLEDQIGRSLTSEERQSIRKFCNDRRTADVAGAWKQITYDRAIAEAKERGKQEALKELQQAKQGSQKPPPGETAEPALGGEGGAVSYDEAIRYAIERGDIPGVDEPL